MIVNGARLHPDPAGGLFWPEGQALFVADLHFEKGSSFAERGTLLPPYDTRATLAHLEALVRRHDPALVVCLGDSFHDARARGRLGDDEVRQIRKLTRSRDWIWVTGNHDPDPPDDLGGRIETEFCLGSLTLRHEPGLDAGAGEISGHLHPKAAVVVRGRRLVRRCFVTDGLRLVMPAFGAYTGGLDVLDPAFAALFNERFQVHMLGRDDVHAIASSKLVQIAANGGP